MCIKILSRSTFPFIARCVRLPLVVLHGVLTGLAISRSRGDILYLNAHENQTTLNSYLRMVPWVRNTLTSKLEENILTFVDRFNGVMNDFFARVRSRWVMDSQRDFGRILG